MSTGAIMVRKLRFKHVAIFLIVSGLLVLLGFRIFQAVKSESQPPSGGGMMGGRMATVQTGVVTTGEVSERVSLVGSLRAKYQVDITPKVTGRIVDIRVDTGHAVRRGALLASIEDEEIQQQLNRSRAAVDVATASVAQREAELRNIKAEMDRKRPLLDAGLLPLQEFEAVETGYQVAEAQRELARAQKRQAEAELNELNIRHSHTRIYAPMSGIVSKRHVDIGAQVNVSTPIVTVVDVSTMVLIANATERDIARIKVGTRAKVAIDSIPGSQYEGRIMRISPLLDPQTRNGVVEIEINNRGGELKGEMFARVDLELGTTHRSLLIPRDALVYRGDEPGVFIAEGETARFRPIQTGLTQAEMVEVISGLQEGETVVTRGANVLKDGDTIRIAGQPQVGAPGGRAEGAGGAPQGQAQSPQGESPGQSGGRGEGGQRPGQRGNN